MADVQPDATPKPAIEAAAEVAPEPAPAEALKKPVQAADDSTDEAVTDRAQPVVEAAESVVESAEGMASTVTDAVTEATSSAPELESTTLVPASGAEEAGGEGGEWELLLGKVKAWLGEGKLEALWAQARNPVSLILAAAALLVVLRVYSALLAAIDSLPLIPGLLELVGVIWALRYGVPKLVQRSQRQELFDSIQQRWQSFRGRG
jgi:hypothetical protein